LFSVPSPRDAAEKFPAFAVENRHLISFLQPENMDNQKNYDYDPLIDKNPPPGAEGTDQGNGSASDYNFDKDTTHVPVESSLSPEEKKILNEANKPGKKDEERAADKPPVQPEKKKKGFFRKLFGSKEGN